jgi:hypothetical protein
MTQIGAYHQKTHQVPFLFYIGVVSYVLSFFLPAVDLGDGGIPGWMCAWDALVGWPSPHVSPLIIFGGLINPVALAYMFLRFLNRASSFRAWLAGIILIFIPLTWASLSSMELRPRIGHAFWITSLLLMICPPIQRMAEASTIRWLTVVPLLVLSWWGLKKAFIPEPSTYQDDFFFMVATDFRAPEFCGKIGRNSGWKSGGESGYEFRYLQSDCYYRLAGITHNQRLCERVRPTFAGLLAGGEYSPSDCKKQMFNQSGVLESPRDEEDFVRVMKALGYDDQFILKFESKHKPGYYPRPDFGDYADFFMYLTAEVEATDRKEFLVRAWNMR